MKTIVIGAGASGLMAAYELSRNGVEVVVLEAQDRIGGRVHTLIPEGFTQTVEAAAEFIHGDLPLTMRLMKKANLRYVPASMDMMQFRDGEFSQAFGSEHWERFEKIVWELRRDCTLTELLERHFNGPQYDSFRKQCLEMAQGLDLADPDRLSVFCIREEWTGSEAQFRPVSGYLPLLDFLSAGITENGGEILLNHRVDRIEWSHGRVAVTSHHDVFQADSIIVTATLGNLQQRRIAFEPPFDDRVFHDIGFGEVVKVLMEFDVAFWEKSHPDLGFLFTRDDFTFWTQLDLRRPLLVGWIGNDQALAMASLTDAVLTDRLLARLSEAFPDADVRSRLKASAVYRYTYDQWTSGGYSWTTPQSIAAIRKINRGLDNTLWFAGEAFERTGNVATVEAALKSGRYIARKVLDSK